MSWRFLFLIERDGEPVPWHGLARWVVVGLAAVGVVAAVVYRTLA